MESESNKDYFCNVGFKAFFETIPNLILHETSSNGE